MQIIIAGGTGFIGQALTSHFLNKDYQVTLLGRDQNKIKKLFGGKVGVLTWENIADNGSAMFEKTDLVINLAGANIAEKKWSKERKKELLDSRILPTKIIAQLCSQLTTAPMLFNASGVGIYGLKNSLHTPYDENSFLHSKQATDFVSQLACEWEAATKIASDRGVRVINMRFAPVLGNKGILQKLRLPFLLGLGGPIGSGQQPFSWIALDDLIRAIDFLITKKEINGPVNFVAPQCLTQKQFAQHFAKILHRPSFLTTPKFFIKFLLGEMGEDLLLQGQCAHPKVLLDNNFTFQYADIDAALEHIFKKT